jgi:hypothetical protein
MATADANKKSLASRFSEEENVKNAVDVLRFVLTLINFGTTMVLACVLLGHAFQMDSITGNQIFIANRVLQSFTDTPPVEIDAFIKKVYGTDTEVVQMIEEITVLPLLLPKMYEISGSNSILRLESVHCNFMLFSSLWIASAFSLAIIHIPGTEPMQWNTFRVMLVHAWNLLGLIFTIVLFSATTKWGSIPTSNLFYALIGQVMAWLYQYFHMVECTQVHVAALKLKYVSTQHKLVTSEKTRLIDIGLQSQYASELRKIVYMDFSVVVPMLLVAGMMPGSSGIDEWRVQTVLFSSWTLFALLGLHLRYRKTLQNINTNGDPLTTDANIDVRGLDALGYLMYAILMVYIMLINAIGSDVFSDPPYTTDRIRQCRWGVRVLVVVAGFLVAETLVHTLKIRFWANWKEGEATNPVKVSNYLMLPPFVANWLVIAFGSFTANILMFSGLSDVNALSTWYK